MASRFVNYLFFFKEISVLLKNFPQKRGQMYVREKRTGFYRASSAKSNGTVWHGGCIANPLFITTTSASASSNFVPNFRFAQLSPKEEDGAVAL